jgi:hypothetical protein
MAFDNSSEELVNSIQPSIDILLASSIDPIINQAVQIRTGDSIDVTMSKNSQIERINNYDITEKQAHFFMNELGVTGVNDQKSIYLTRLIITMVFDQIAQTAGLSPTIAIPLNDLKKQIVELEVDLNVLKTVDESLMNQFYPININAFLTLLISDNDEIKTFTIDQIQPEEINEIWEQLGLKDNISQQTKNKIINIFLSVVITEIEKSEQGEFIQSIPLGTIKSLIPQGVSEALSYDILHTNYTTRAQELNNLRISCETKKIDVKEVCDIILLTKYDYFLTEIENLSQLAKIEIPQIYLDEIEKVNTIEKLNNQIDTLASYKNLTFIIGILILILCGISYYTHLKINDLQISLTEIIHKINKYNLINFTISYLFLVIGIFIITSDKVFEIVTSKVPADVQLIVQIFPTLPLFIEFTNTLYQIISYSTFYLIILIIIFIGLHFKIKNTEKQPYNKEKNNYNKY